MFGSKLLLLIQCFTGAVKYCMTVHEDSNSKCSTGEIIGLHSINYCNKDDSTTYKRLTEVEDGAICSIKCKDLSTTVQVTCENGVWIGGCETITTGVIHRRKRRFLKALGCFLWPGWSCKGPRDTRPPSVIGCTRQDETAEELKSYKHVEWIGISAYDQEDKSEPKIHSSPRGSGSKFFEGKTVVSQYAIDRSGNMGKCSFDINVKVITCKAVSDMSGGYFQCFPSQNWRFGTKCTFYCYSGYNLSGSKGIECTKYGHWSPPIPSCQKVKCPKLLLPIEPTNYTCTDHNFYGSICKYSCKGGYGIPEDMAKVLICKSSRMWSGPEPKCKDIIPPKITTCPTSTVVFADRNNDSAVIVWKEPKAKDNLDGPISVNLMSGPASGQRVKVGSYLSVYSAFDRAGNEVATKCEIRTIIKQITCPRLYSKPYTRILCPDGNRYGATCEYQCEDGAVLKGSSNKVVCERNGNATYGMWSYGLREPFCEVVESCALQLNPPLNGALACDYWLGGKFCQMQCRKGFDVDPGYQKVSMFVCSEEGRWFPTTVVPACSHTVSPSSASTSVSVYYDFDGDCQDADVRTEIRENFIRAFQHSDYSEVCAVYIERCNIDNVQVLCGTQTQKRSVNTVKVKFEIRYKLKEPMTSSDFLRLSSNLYDLSLNASNGDYDIQLSNNYTIHAVAAEKSSLNIDCDHGTVPSYRTSSCVGCQKGTYYNSKTKSCELCAKGYFQNQSASEFCFACEKGTTTEFEGSTGVKECKAACPPGYWSVNGIKPCNPCDRGTFQKNWGSSQCYKCEGVKTTVNHGSNSDSDCKDFDIVFMANQTDHAIEMNVSYPTNDTDLTLSFWFQIENVSEVAQLMKVENDIILFGISVSEKLFVHFECADIEIEIDKQRWNFFRLTIHNNSMIIESNGFKHHHNDQCFALPEKSILTIGGPNFAGKISQFNIWSFNVQQGSNSLRCNGNQSGNIVSWKQFEDIDLYSTIHLQMPSDCDDIDECVIQNISCGHGQCMDTLNDHLCMCEYGYTGKACELNIDDCIDNICEHNASCIDGVGSYKCNCREGFKGDFCDIIIVNGSWSVWGEWTHCSRSCGFGERSRIRDCNDPPPRNGGTFCEGHGNETEGCILSECPYCKTWNVPNNATLSCNNDTEADTINCTLACDDGYDFDSPPRPFYVCGPKTFYLWEFETDDNPTKRVPSCYPIQDASDLIVTYKARYESLKCYGSQTEIDQEVQQIRSFVENNTKCLENEYCSIIDFKPLNCQKEFGNNAVELYAKFSCQPDKYGSDLCYKSLEDAIESMQTYAIEGFLNVQIDGKEYQIDSNDSHVSGEVMCPEGNQETSFYCVPCGEGKYHDGIECKKCEFGQYQPNLGSTSCKECSRNFTTLGRGSTSVSDCIDKIPPNIQSTCPVNITKTVPHGIVAVNVTWKTPVAVDNSGINPVIRLLTANPPGSEFTSNTTTFVQYLAVDENGNNSTCEFYVMIKVLPQVQTENETKDNLVWFVVGGCLGFLVIVTVIVVVLLLSRRTWRVTLHIFRRSKHSDAKNDE